MKGAGAYHHDEEPDYDFAPEDAREEAWYEARALTVVVGQAKEEHGPYRPQNTGDDDTNGGGEDRVRDDQACVGAAGLVYLSQ